MSDVRIPLAGVIGHPIAQSKSPALFRHWFRELGVRGHYIPIDVVDQDLEEVLRTMPKMGFVGCNVTLPFKEHALGIADNVSDRATLVGAANTLSFGEDGRIYADNTDGYGFIENLKHGAPDWEPGAGPTAVLGAGGASRAIIIALLEEGVPEIFISNRTRIRAENLKSDFGAKITVVDWVNSGNMLEDAATVVNTTSLGMVGKQEFRVPLDNLSPKAVVTDIVYSPLQTKLLQEAAEIGCRTVDGLGMLLHQAVPGFDRWFGTRPEVNEKTRAAILR
ncbi:MAG: shikimate dehydrogenase [Paracoccaceae bacterium]|nr:shikimate dehydrogenase [Paracoccaceae bacterium]MDG1738422.1 shikimate dehydrogenase [Paracoccaceae bacterium]MDG2259831.1 shikimate dehydrogenase [Paracoccaceae bacterium]